MPSVDRNVTIHHANPGFHILKPEEVESSKGDVIWDWGGVKIIRLSDQVAVKYGPKVRLQEAETLNFLAPLSVSSLIPKLFASYTCISQFPYPDGSYPLSTYIFLEYMPGETLQKVWSTLNSVEKVAVCQELDVVLTKLRALQAPSYIGSVNGGPVLDNIVEQIEEKGPFKSTAEFHQVFAKNFARIHKGQVYGFVKGLLGATQRHEVVFTHADLRRDNIIVQNGKITGIIDWEMAGWYPEYWEFAKVFANYGFQDDWGDHILGVLKPYFAETAAYGYVSQHLW